MSAEGLALARAEWRRRTMPAFATPVASRVDAHGRLWVVGMEDDSAFADVFTGHQFLTRIHIGCHFFNDSSSLRDRWLALVCAPESAEFEGDAVVKLFEIQ
jgi:hypothetical protein